MRCIALRRNCKQCGSRYLEKRVEKCTTCGNDMHCKKDAIPGYKFCEKHGGPQPRYNWYGRGRAPVNGKHSSSKLVKLASRYIELTSDPRYLSNRHSMGIVWHRVEELVKRIEENQSPERVAALYRLWKEFRDHEGHGRTVEAVKAKSQIDEEFEKVYHDYNSWTQLFEAVDLYRKMAESEVKIAKDLKAVVSTEDALDLVSQLLAIVIQVENDPIKLKRIIYEFRKLVGDSADRVEEVAHTRAGGGSGEVIDA